MSPSGPGLPCPPDDAEAASYLDPPRWALWVEYAGFLLVVVSVIFFVRSVPWAFPLLVPLALTMAASTLALATSVRRGRVTAASHRAVVTTSRSAPGVDVFLPSAGEDLAVLANTFAHVAAMEHRGELTVHVLDDSDREAVEYLALQYGFTYVVRPDRGHLKKAGNLRHGFERSGGDLVLVLDADFAPRADFLAQTVPYFDDPRLGILQTPQFFSATAAMNWLQRAAGATQVLFYRWIQPSRDAMDATVCVGTCALYRRTALDAVGGFTAIEHSEDVHTGVRVTRAGWTMRYLPVVLSRGLCPEGLDQFLNQQYRWCNGSISLAVDPGFHRQRMGLGERASHYSGFLYYLTTAVDVFLAWLPPLVLALFYPGRIRPENYVFVMLALVVRYALVPVVTNGTGTFLGLLRVQMTYGYAHAVAIVDALARSTEAWTPTGTTRRTALVMKVRAVATAHITVVQVLAWTAVVVNAPRLGWGHWSLMIAFTVLHLLVAGPVALGRTSWRRTPRTLDLRAPVVDGAEPVTAGAHDAEVLR